MLLSVLSIFTTEGAVLTGRYEGICTLQGDLVDNWAVIDLDGEDAEFNFGGEMNFLSPYKETGTASDRVVTSTVPGGYKWVFKSTDGGESLQGTLPFMGKTLKVWVVKVPRRPKLAQESEDVLKEIISSNDGYTSFIKVYQPGGVVACITSDFSFGADDTFAIKCDSQVVQDILSNLSGTYKIEGNKIIMTDNQGVTFNGDIYNKGSYLVIPLGNHGSKRLEMVLIR